MDRLKLPQKESDVQAACVAALSAAGFEVMHTSAFRQRGPSGTSPGVPDLLVASDAVPCCLLGLEVKTARGSLSAAQRRLVLAGHIHVVRSPAEAVDRAREWLEVYGGGCGVVAAKIARAHSVADQLRDGLGTGTKDLSCGGASGTTGGPHAIVGGRGEGGTEGPAGRRGRQGGRTEAEAVAGAGRGPQPERTAEGCERSGEDKEPLDLTGETLESIAARLKENAGPNREVEPGKERFGHG